MKAYKLEILILDFDKAGENGIKQVLEYHRYSNDCIHPHVMKIVEAEIGEWSDDHPFNKKSTIESEYQKTFGGK